jgi:hypothetical protein
MIIVEIKLCHPVWIEHGLSYVKIMVCINLLYAIGARDLLSCMEAFVSCVQFYHLTGSRSRHATVSESWHHKQAFFLLIHLTRFSFLK